MFILFILALIIVDVMIVLGAIYGLLVHYKAKTTGDRVWWVVLIVSIVVYIFRFFNACSDLMKYESEGNPMVVFFIPIVAVVVVLIISKIKSNRE